MWIFDAQIWPAPCCGHSWLVFISRVRLEMKGASKESAPGNHSNSERALHTYDQSLHWSIGPTRRSAAPLPIQPEMSSTRTPFLSLPRWLTQTAGDSVYPLEFNIIRAPTLPCSSFKRGTCLFFSFRLSSHPVPLEQNPLRAGGSFLIPRSMPRLSRVPLG